MALEFAPECCDADAYLAFGQACADNVSECWHGLRPVGAVVYFSLPFRFGIAAHWIIVLNALLVALSAAIGFGAMTVAAPRASRVARAFLAVAIPVAHAVFMIGTIRNALSDGPSACAALIALWTLVIALKRDSRALHLVAGTLLGLATILRAFYLYPALIAAGILVVLALASRQGRQSAALFCVTLAIPIAVQFSATHARVQSWSFIDPASAAYGERLHFQTDAYGYDTLLPARGLYYPAPECFHDAVNMGDALRKREWDEVLCLVARRQWFYFGSYVPGGRTYLARATERHFSVPFLLANVLAAGLSLWWVFSRKSRARLFLVPVAFLGASLAEASLIIPEARFMMAVHVAIWMFAAMAVREIALRFVPGGSSLDESDEPPEPVATTDPLLGWCRERLGRLRAWWADFDVRSLRRPEVIAPAAAIAVTLVVHGVALTSDLQDEDLRHVYESQQLETFPFLVRPYGNHFCAFFRLTVILLYGLFGVHAAGYFAVMLLTHAVHVALLYGIIRALTQSRSVAGLFAALWGASPAFQGTLQWFAAYSHMLGATAVLYPLYVLARAREEQRPPTARALVYVSIALVLGAATELTGTLSAAAFPLLALLFLPRASAPVRTALWLAPSAALSVYLAVHFAAKGNSMVLAFFSIVPAMTMFAELVSYGVGLVVAGPLLAVGANYYTWLLGMSTATAVAVSAVVFLPALAVVVKRLVRGDWDERRVLLTGVCFAGLMYAAVAAGRSGLTFGHPLADMATRDRYHYDASIGLAIAMAVAAAKTWPKLEFPSRGRIGRLAFALAALWAVCGLLVARTTYLHGGGRQEWTRDWEDLAEGSVRLLLRRVPEGGMLFVRNDLFRPAGLIFAMSAPKTVFPGIGAYWILAHGPGTVDDRYVRFVEMDLKLLKKIRQRTRREVAQMFVSPGQVLAAHGEIRTLEADAPPEIARYLASSSDPMFAPPDRERVKQLRDLLRREAERPLERFGPAPIVATPDPVELPPVRRLPTKEELERQILERKIHEDPKAMEAVRQAILKDPKMMDEVRKALREAQEAEE